MKFKDLFEPTKQELSSDAINLAKASIPCLRLIELTEVDSKETVCSMLAHLWYILKYEFNKRVYKDEIDFISKLVPEIENILEVSKENQESIRTAYKTLSGEALSTLQEGEKFLLKEYANPQYISLENIGQISGFFNHKTSMILSGVVHVICLTYILERKEFDSKDFSSSVISLIRNKEFEDYFKFRVGID